MTAINRLRTLRYGIHSGANDFTSTPTLAVLQPTDDGASFLRRSRNFLGRALASTDGRRFPHVRGGKDVAALALALEFKGINSNTGAAVTAWEAKMEQGNLLASLFGAVAPATTGVAPTVAASGHTPATGILAVVGTTTANGQSIAFPTSTGWEVGVILSGGGTTALTLTHPYSGTPTSGATILRNAVYSGLPQRTQHTHCMFSAEHNTEGTGNLRTDYYGCAPGSMELVLPDNGKLEFNSSWMPTNWEDVAVGSPSFAAPTAGNPCVNNGYRFRIGTSLFVLRNARFSVDNSVTMRPAGSNVNGVLGGVCGTGEEGKVFMLSGELYYGGGAAITEIIDNSGTPPLGALTGDADNAGAIGPTYDVLLGFGSEAGSCGGIRMPAADIQARLVSSGAFPVVQFTAYGTGPAPVQLFVG
jgi:hypothetical protein